MDWRTTTITELLEEGSLRVLLCREQERVLERRELQFLRRFGRHELRVREENLPLLLIGVRFGKKGTYHHALLFPSQGSLRQDRKAVEHTDELGNRLAVMKTR